MLRFPRPLLRSLRPVHAMRPLQSQRLYATGQVSSQPGSKDFKELKDNALEEAKSVKDTVAAAISGANSRTSQINPDESGVQAITADAEAVYGIFRHVPKNAMLFGTAGVLPYAATSATTIYLSRQAGLAMSPENSTLDAESALALLTQVEGVQMAYGAIILSFIGSIHWGLEFAGYGGHKGMPRYLLGIAPVLVGMPTLLLEGQIGLAAQFAAFCATWFADQRATVYGWAPRWYATYRFWLTALVGSCLVVTLGATNYFGPGSNLATTGRRLQEVNMAAEKEWAGISDRETGKAKEGTIKGEVKAEETEEAYVQLTNVRKKKEAEQKQKEEAEKKKKEEAEQKAQSEKEEREKAGREVMDNKTPGA